MDDINFFKPTTSIMPRLKFNKNDKFYRMINICLLKVATYDRETSAITRFYSILPSYLQSKQTCSER